jgi:hypothetical protein
MNIVRQSFILVAWKEFIHSPTILNLPISILVEILGKWSYLAAKSALHCTNPLGRDIGWKVSIGENRGGKKQLFLIRLNGYLRPFTQIMT